MDALKKVQSLPESKRKIILWLVVVIIGLVLFVFWARGFQQKIKSFRTEKLKEELKLPSFEEELKEFEKLPLMEMPKINGKEE